MRCLLPVLLVLSLSSNAYAQAPASLPLTHVTLYTSGVGYFERTGSVIDDSQTDLDFPVDQVNDVLKSLVVIDYGGGTIEPVTYGAQDTMDKQLKAYSIDVSDDPSQAQLLDRMRGTQVTVAISGTPQPTPVTGTIVGVETKTVNLPNSATTTSSTLNLMTDDSLVGIPLDSIASVTIDDSALRAEFKQALATVAEGRDTSKRPVTINFSGHGTRKVLIGYLTQTPLWQTSYRLVLGKKPFVEGWALVQNTSSEDWNGVSLDLVAGRPISFIQDLYSPVYIDRPIVQPQITGSPTPQLYSSNLAADRVSTGMGGGRRVDINGEYGLDSNSINGVGGTEFSINQAFANKVSGLSATPAVNAPPISHGFVPNVMNSPSEATGAKLGTALFSYSINVPVTIPRQKSAMIPFINSDIVAQKVSIYNQQVEADHPLTGARITNNTGVHLMGGPLTVFDDNASGGTGYVGDALIDDTEPGQTRLVSFAVDLAVDASSENGPSSGLTSILKIVKGVIWTSTVWDSEIDYTFKNNSDEDRTIVVEHPYQGSSWTLLEPKAYTERTANLYRFDVPVAAKASKVFKVKEESVQYTSQGILDLNVPTLLDMIKTDKIDPQTANALQVIAAQQNAIADTQTKIANNEAEQASITAGQDRIRENMKVLDNSTALYTRYANELDAQETKINNLDTDHDALEQSLHMQQNKLDDEVNNLTID
jgi:hypothetical protein